MMKPSTFGFLVGRGVRNLGKHWAMKAALEQAQALYGNIPGFEGTDLMKMHEKLMQDSVMVFLLLRLC